jgi:sugar O-acyltransferase (sialic acid O-acetyltransferase NeuD family)
MKDVIIFGTTSFAEVACVYLTQDSPYNVAAFTVNEQYITQTSLLGRQVVAFEKLKNYYPSDRYAMFVAIGFSGLNRTRTSVYEACKAEGYEMISYINSKATHWGEIEVGDNVFIFEENVIQPFVKIGNNTILWSGNHIGHHTAIGNNVFIASHAVISGHCHIGDNCFIGVNATFADGVTVAAHSFIGMGAMITKDTVEKGVYKGFKSEAASFTTDEMKGL